MEAFATIGVGAAIGAGLGSLSSLALTSKMHDSARAAVFQFMTVVGGSVGGFIGVMVAVLR